MRVECFEQNQKQIFCWIKEYPLSLVMLKKPEVVLKNMFNLKSLCIILIAQDVYLSPEHKKILEQKLRASVFLFHNCNQALKFIKNKAKQSRVQILAGEYFLENISNYCSQLQNVQGIIKCSIQGYNKHKFAKQFGCLLQKLKRKYKNNIKKKDLANFQLIKDFPWDSYILLRTMKLMLRDDFPKKLLIQHLSKLINLLPENDDQPQNKQIFIKLLREKKLSELLTIQWYTKQSFLYPLINNILRSCRHPSQVFYIQPYFRLLFSAIKSLYQKQKAKKKNLNFTCYRGGHMKAEELQNFKQNIGCLVRNLCFLSTSKIESYQWVENVLFEIDVDVEGENRNQQLDYGYSFISKYSLYKSEQQILFNPLNFFRIISVQQQSRNQLVFHKIYLKYGIKLKENAQYNNPQQNLILYQSKNKQFGCFGQMFVLQYHSLDYDHFWSKFFQLANDNISKIFFYFNIYPLLIKKREIYKVLELYEKFIELLKGIQDKPQNQIGQQFSNYFYLLALMRYTYALTEAKQYQKAKQMLQQRIKLLVCDKEGQASILSTQCDLQLIKHQYESAARKIEKGCEIVKDIYGEINIYYFFFLKKLAIVYLRARNYISTSDCLNKCLNIIYQIYGGNHLQAARIYEYIAQNEINFGNNAQALVNLNKSLQVKKRLFKQDNREFAETYFRIGWVCKIQNNLKIGLQMLQKAEQSSMGLQQRDTLKILIQILKGCLYRLVKKHQKALQILQGVQILVQQQFGKISEIKMTILIEKALNIWLKQDERALKYLNEAKQIGIKIFGQRNNNIFLISQYYIIHILIKKNQLTKAAILLEECQQLINKIGENEGKQNMKYSFLKLKSSLFFDSKRYQQALQCYKIIYHIQRNKNQKSWLCLTALNNLMETQQKLNHKGKALIYSQQCLNIIQKINIQNFKQTHPQITTIISNIKKIRRIKNSNKSQTTSQQKTQSFCFLDFII